ncbi:MAG: hypothetical protein K0B10_14035 [Vicingaceae bacterium]|nr:hypothetical protein [Vicingaceae bacterium]
MKKLITVIITSILFTGLYAQQTKSVYDEIIQNSPYIFEGKIISYSPIDKGEGQKYVSYTIEIQHIFREQQNLNKGTIELITPLPQFWHIVDLPDGTKSILINQPEHFELNEIKKIEFSSGMSGIFFCKQLDVYPSLSQAILNNKLSVQNYCEDKTCFLQYTQVSNVDTETKQIKYSTKAEFFNKKFDSKEDVYQFLKQYNNISLPTIKKKMLRVH